MIRLPMALGLLLLPVLASAAETPADFGATATIDPDGAGPYYELALPIQAHFAARSPDLKDLRVFNGQGEAVPFALIRAQAQTDRAEQQIAVKWFPIYAADASPDALRQVRVEKGPDGTIVSLLDNAPPEAAAQKRRGYILDTSQAKGADRKLALDWDPAVTGFQQVTVEASDDLQTWHLWTSAAQLARLEFNGEHVERKQIDLSGGHAAYLRLTWQVPAEAPSLTAALLTVGSATDRPAELAWSDPAPPSRTENGSLEWDYPAPVPFERVKIALPQVNVVIPVDLSVHDAQAPRGEWRLPGRHVLYRLLIDGKEWQQPDIALNAMPITAIRLTPDPRAGGFGTGAPLLSVGVTAQHLSFLARGAGPFTLAIGKDDAKAVELTPTTLMPGYGTSTAPPISPAKLGPLTGAKGGAPEMPAGGWQSYVLWGVLLLGVGVIGFMAMRLLRQAKG